MCCCGKPNKNGEPGYSWDGKSFSTRQVDPPDMEESDTLLHDEPGRCGGLDSHCHHLRLVRRRYDGLTLLVRHGGGDECLTLRDYNATLEKTLAAMDSDSRYWALLAILRTAKERSLLARSEESLCWRTAIAEGRVKRRKLRGQSAYRVTIDARQVVTA